MRRHGPQLSDRCITALVADGIITLDEVKDVADDAGLEIEVQPDGSLKKRRKLIAFFDPPVPVRNPRRVEQAIASLPPIPVRNPRRLEPQVVEAPVTIPEPKEITPVPPPAVVPSTPVPPTPEPAPEVKKEPTPEPETKEEPKKKSVLERAVEIIKKGYEKDYIRKPDHDTVKPKVSHRERPAARKIIEKRKKTAAPTRKERVKANRVKKTYKRKYSVQAQDRRRNKRLHGFDSDYVVTPGGYGSNFQMNERFRIQK